MKKLKCTLAFILSLLFFSNYINAQDYSLAGGVRLGYPLSLSLKYVLTEGHAVEAFLGTRGYSRLAFGYRSTVVGGAYLLHFPLEIDELPGLYWYVGAGGSIYLYNYDSGINDPDRVNSSFSVQGYVGVDYAFGDFPLNVSVDWSPTLVLRGFNSGFGGDYGSVGLRYIFGQ